MHELRIAENLIRLRHERKITQEELADYIGVTKGSVSKWEKNISKPDLQTIPVLATFFGVTIDELLDTCLSFPRMRSRSCIWTIPIPLPYQILIKR